MAQQTSTQPSAAPTLASLRTAAPATTQTTAPEASAMGSPSTRPSSTSAGAQTEVPMFSSTWEPAGRCVGLLPDGTPGDCSGCLSTLGVCYPSEKEWCDKWDDFRWCGEEASGLPQGWVGVGGASLGVLALAALLLLMCVVRRCCSRGKPQPITELDVVMASRVTPEFGRKPSIPLKTIPETREIVEDWEWDLDNATPAAYVDEEADVELGGSALKVGDAFDEGLGYDEPCARCWQLPPFQASRSSSKGATEEADGAQDLQAAV